MPITPEEYAARHSSALPTLLQEVLDFTEAQHPHAHMISGHVQGQLLRMLSFMLQPKYILEIGTFTGYSALCLAEGLTPDGKLITIDNNEETIAIAERYFRESEFASQIISVKADAAKYLKDLEGPVDLVFIDADKENYALYYDLIIDKVRKGGLILADNVLWSGKVLDPDKHQDKDTQSIMAFTRKLNEDTRVSTFLLPIRDGILMARVL